MTTVPTSEQLVDLFEQGLLADEMARRFKLHDQVEIEAIESRCVELHNEGNIDLLKLVESEAFKGLNADEFFTVSHILCRILPELEATPSRMMACVESLVIRGGADMLANQPNAFFRIWCEKDPRRAHEVIALALGGDDLAIRNLTFAFEAIHAIAEARQISLAYDDARRLSAITALGRIEDNDPDSRSESLAAFNSILDTGADDNLRANLLHATAAILSRDLGAHSSSGAAALVGRLVEDAGESTMHRAAHVLWAYPKALQADIVASLLRALIRLNPANKETVNELDLGLQMLLKLGYDDAAIVYVTELFSRPDDSLELNDLDSFTRTLVSGAGEHFSRVVVKWLLQGNKRLCDGLAKVIRGHNLEGPPLDIRVEDLAISSTAQVFLCRKAIGWFFLKPTTAASVFVSVLRVCDTETAQELHDLLVNVLLLNYNGIRNYLESLAPDDAAKGCIDKALAANDSYLNELNASPLINELQPTEHQRRIERLRMSDQMHDASKQAVKKSVLLSMVKRSVLLYGNRSLSFVKNGTDELRPVEMDLQPFGISFEMPRMEIVDPVGLDYMIRVFRNEMME